MAFQINEISNFKTSNHKERKRASFLQKEVTFFNSVFGNKVKEDFYTELGVLLKAGITLRDGLELLTQSIKKKQDQNILKHIIDDIVSGKTLSEALYSHKEFTRYEYYSLKIGEETGTLPLISEQLGYFYAKKNEQRRNLISALTYPIIILSTAILVVFFMLRYVVPMFQDIFKQQNVELPTITKIIIKLSALLGDYGWLFLIIFAILFVLNRLFKSNLRLSKIKDSIIFKTPYIGNFIKVIYLSQFTQAVSLLTASKVPMVQSIQLVKQMIDFFPLQEALSKVELSLLKGKSLSSSLSEIKLFDNKMVALVKVAEETNKTELIFDRLNMQYHTQMQQQSKILSTIMEPLIILIVAVIVGVILIAMYLPMFKLSSAIG